MKMTTRFVLCVTLSFFFHCASKKHKDISYLDHSVKDQVSNPKLNVFVPSSSENKKLPVLIFVHGGYWNSGSKDSYGFLGRNFAKKGVVTVIPDYTLSPNANYNEMADQIVEVVRWSKKNIQVYHGDTDHIFLMGHSAGGHLITLIATNPTYLKDPTDISGIILNDAAGLDMYDYFQRHPPTKEHDYLTTWSNDPATWKKASPVYFLSQKTPPIKIYLGKKTYDSIQRSNHRFLNELKKFQPDISIKYLNKKHVPMMTQFIWPWNDRYAEILQFMEKYSGL